MVKNNSGFTLLELIIVFTIMGVLAMGGLASYAVSQKNARDARRKTDLQTFRQALELYRADPTHGHYLTDSAGHWTKFDPLYSALTGPLNCSGNACISATSYPDDPSSTQHYFYKSDATGATYELCAQLENPSVGDQCASAALGNCGTGLNCNYGVTQP